MPQAAAPECGTPAEGRSGDPAVLPQMGDARAANFLVRVASESRSQAAKTKRERPLAPGTLRIFLAAISWRYRQAGRIPPTTDARVNRVLLGLRRLSDRQQRQVKAFREHEIARILSHCDVLAAQGRERIQ